ncbi:SHOCT domain-containing protein [Dactylosporangium sp. McL0621]|uniref:SHOCT domain-containing protein n=1 Tax=Dactylosporangium sp. McL0621 TaxID=3415678 RepID=UPI003CE7199E
MSQIRRVIGLLIAALSFGASLYGLFHLVRNGSCASGGNYVSTRECAPDTGKWFLFLFGGILLGLLGIGVAFIKGIAPNPTMAELETEARARLAANRTVRTPQDPIARLERLQALRDAGTLSPAEFERLKAEILAGH